MYFLSIINLSNTFSLSGIQHGICVRADDRKAAGQLCEHGLLRQKLDHGGSLMRRKATERRHFLRRFRCDGDVQDNIILLLLKLKCLGLFLVLLFMLIAGY